MRSLLDVPQNKRVIGISSFLSDWILWIEEHSFGGHTVVYYYIDLDKVT